MIPKTKSQKEVCQLSKRLTPIPQTILNKMREDITEKRMKHYYGVLDYIQGWTVVRYICYIKYTKVKDRYYEFMQIWLSEDSQHLMAKKRSPFSYYFDSFIVDSAIELRESYHNYSGYRLTDINYNKLFVRSKKAKRMICGYNKHVYSYVNNNGVYLTDDLRHVIELDSIYETIFKQDIDLFLNLKHAHAYGESITPAVRTAWKDKYLSYVDLTLWRDTMNMAAELNLDLHNKHYACPDDLHRDHDIYCNRVNRLRRRRQIDEDREAAKNKEAAYMERMKPYLGIMFESGDIIIRPLQSVSEFVEEANTMHHCVYDNGYYEQKDTIIFSAQVNGQRTETIEYNTKDNKVVQCRGRYNKPTEYHDEILEIINNNKKLINAAI